MKDVVDGGAKCINMHREYDGEQVLNFIQGRPSTWRLLAVVLVLKMSADTLSGHETTYRCKEVFLVDLSPP